MPFPNTLVASSLGFEWFPPIFVRTTRVCEGNVATVFVVFFLKVGIRSAMSAWSWPESHFAVPHLCLLDDVLELRIVRMSPQQSTELKGTLRSVSTCVDVSKIVSQLFDVSSLFWLLSTSLLCSGWP